MKTKAIAGFLLIITCLLTPAAQACDHVRLFHHWQSADNCAQAGQHLGDGDQNYHQYGQFQHGCHFFERGELAYTVVEKDCREGDADKPECNFRPPDLAPRRCGSSVAAKSA